jgi:hypothetical protein
MKGVVSWAHHIHAMHPWHPILRFTKALGQHGEKLLLTDEILAEENSIKTKASIIYAAA